MNFENHCCSVCELIFISHSVFYFILSYRVPSIYFSAMLYTMQPQLPEDFA